MAVTANMHALAGVFMAITALMTKVDQSRVHLAHLAIMALY